MLPVMLLMPVSVMPAVTGGSVPEFTVNIVPGPAADALLPALSEAVPAAMLIPSVPFPVIDEIVTVGVFVVPLLTLTVPPAVPVVFSVTFAVVRFTPVEPL